MYGIFRLLQLVGVVTVTVLIVLVFDGHAHVAGSIVSHIFHLIFGHLLVSFFLFVGLIAGNWIGGDVALTRLGKFEHRQRWDRIKQ